MACDGEQPSVPNQAQACLPAEGSRNAVPVPHFPAHFQAIIWRNWGLVPRERLAQVIGVDLDTLDAQAGLLGLKTDDSLTEKWLKCGYQTIIRQNWHLAGLQDLLVMLGWDANRLAFTLKEDDFLWYKMGQMKPAVPSPRYVPLTSEQMKATEELRNYLSEVRDRLPERKETPFAFKNGSATGTLQPNNSLPGLRLAYSYSALYGDPLLDPELDPFPDADLERYAAAGVNALWMHVVLHSLIPWMGADNPLSAGWNERLENLRRLCRRLSAWNIQL
ncbi:MAG: hypothetical protein IJJ33_00195, partial [Victivallales bacterium]|nr:hypothetical protein [Victivallales bacterium]